MKKILPTFLLFVIVPFFANTQTTGSFQLNINFPQADYNETRTLYFYVPENYDPSISYKMIVGFRGGPNTNAGQFRDQLQPLSDSLDAIILCPENAAHFWNEEGRTKLLFQYSLDTAMAMYNIDPDFIYLTGLSYGGRHAVIVATDTDDGPIPKLRGVIPFAAGAEADLQPNYDSIDEFAPACICIGLQDSNDFINVANNLHNAIQNNGGASMLNEIPGVGHTVAFPTFPAEMMECFNFIESQYEPSAASDFLENNFFEISPNPTNAPAILKYSLPQKSDIAEFIISGIYGKTLQIINVENKEGEIILDQLNTGQYFVLLKINGKIIGTKRLVIMK